MGTYVLNYLLRKKQPKITAVKIYLDTTKNSGISKNTSNDFIATIKRYYLLN